MGELWSVGLAASYLLQSARLRNPSGFRQSLFVTSRVKNPVHPAAYKSRRMLAVGGTGEQKDKGVVGSVCNGVTNTLSKVLGHRAAPFGGSGHGLRPGVKIGGLLLRSCREKRRLQGERRFNQEEEKKGLELASSERDIAPREVLSRKVLRSLRPPSRTSGKFFGSDKVLELSDPMRCGSLARLNADSSRAPEASPKGRSQKTEARPQYKRALENTIRRLYVRLLGYTKKNILRSI